MRTGAQPKGEIKERQPTVGPRSQTQDDHTAWAESAPMGMLFLTLGLAVVLIELGLLLVEFPARRGDCNGRRVHISAVAAGRVQR